MQTRFLTRAETDEAARWCCVWCGADDEAHRKVHRMAFPDEWTMGAVGEDDRPVAAGAIYIPLSGMVGFAGRVVTNPDATRLKCASAIRALIPAMRDALFKYGMLEAVAMFDEEPLANLFSNSHVPVSGCLRAYAFRRE